MRTSFFLPILVAAAVIAAFTFSHSAAAQPTFVDVTAQWVPATLAGDAWEKDISVADLDRDGDPDVIVVRKLPFSNPGTASDLVLLNEGGTLVPFGDPSDPSWPMNSASDARDVFVADFTGDLYPDIVIVTTFDDPLRFYRNLGVDGEGQWAGLVAENNRMPNLPGQQFCAGWGGDVDGDGDRDLYMSGYGGTPDVLYIQQADGTFTDESNPRIGELAFDTRFGTSAEMHDLDSDGDLDIVFNKTLTGTPETAVLYNDGTGHFTLPGGAANKQTLTLGDPYMFTVGDLDENGELDFYVVKDSLDSVLLTQSTLPDGPISFVDNPPLNQPRTSGLGGNVKFGDADEDGDLDVGISSVDVDIPGCDRQFALALNDGNGTFTDPYSSDEPFHVPNYDFDFADLDQDGCQEIILGLCPTGYQVFDDPTCNSNPTLSVTADGATVTGPLLVTNGSQLRFNAIASDPDGLGYPIFAFLGNPNPFPYVWLFDGATPGNPLQHFIANPLVTFDLEPDGITRTFDLNVRVYDTLANFTDQEIPVTTTDPPDVSVTADGVPVSGPIFVTSGSTVQFATTASDQDGLGFPVFAFLGNPNPIAYVWLFDGATPGNPLQHFIANPRVTFDLDPGEPSRTFTVKVAVFDTLGVSTTVPVTVEVTP